MSEVEISVKEIIYFLPSSTIIQSFLQETQTMKGTSLVNFFHLLINRRVLVLLMTVLWVVIQGE